MFENHKEGVDNRKCKKKNFFFKFNESLFSIQHNDLEQWSN